MHSARTLAAPDAPPYVPGEYRPGPEAQSEEELMEFARNYGTTVFHPVGTCKMGTDAHGRRRRHLRVHGMAGCAWSMLDHADDDLRQYELPVIMMAEKAADTILGAANTSA